MSPLSLAGPAALIFTLDRIVGKAERDEFVCAWIRGIEKWVR